LGATNVKAVCKYVDEIDKRNQFHQCSTYNFYMCRAQKRKKDTQVISLFILLESACAKAVCKYVDEIDTWGLRQFHFFLGKMQKYLNS